MSQSDDRAMERRVEERARHLWESEGRPKGGAGQFRDRARQLIAIEDNPHAATEPVPDPPRQTGGDRGAEPLEAVENQGEFPTLTDQGEETTAPRRRRKS